MQYVLATYKVDNYIAWKKVFDEYAKDRYVAGEIAFQLLTPKTDSNKVVHYSSWRGLTEAVDFFESKELVHFCQ